MAKDQNNQGEMSEKKGIKSYIVHLVIAAVLVGIVALVVVRLNIWSHRTTTVEKIYEVGELKSESQDNIVYRDPAKPFREPDGVTRAVIFGNYMVDNYGKDKSIINMLKENFDWEFIDLSVDATCIAQHSQAGEERELFDNFCLFKMVEYILTGTKSDYQKYAPFYREVDKDAFVEKWRSVDFNKVDKVIIMYSLMDYYYINRRTGENDETSVFGSLFKTIQTLQAAYPHLEIILSSGYPEYIIKDDGTVEYGYTSYYGGTGMDDENYGTQSMYAQIEAYVALSTLVTYIDNFYCGINEENIHDYVDQQNLTDAGIELIGNHIVDVLKRME
ncbi:MAG: hypothetical protein K6E19_03520 [Lachnospiraceae bacterium]|nr:hypothetical protein [Lachnospiraceae bacterium]